MDTNNEPPVEPRHGMALAHALGDLLVVMSGIAWRRSWAHGLLQKSVSNLAEQLATCQGYDSEGNSPEEQRLLAEVDPDELPDADEPGEPGDEAA